MDEHASINEAVLAALREYNGRVADDERLPLDRDTVLLGDGGRLDSLGLINLLTTVERSVGERLGREIVIVSEEALCRGSFPVSTVGTLLDYVCEVAA